MVGGRMTTTWPTTLHWWIDEVGGFLTFLKPQIRIGQAGDPRNDVGVMANISSRHADIVRTEGGLQLAAHAPTQINGKQVQNALLRDKDRITMQSVEITCHQPVAWSPTTRLVIGGRHRLPLAMDAILMLGETCILGPKADAHIPTDWDCSVFVTWHRDSYWVRCAERLIVDGEDVGHFAPLTPTSEVELPWGAFRWEPASP
jgi:hypothetical protein